MNAGLAAALALGVVPVRDNAPILQDDNPLLREVSQAVLPGENVRALADVMARVLDEHGGQGLAAVQLGVLRRVILIRERGQPDLFMVNPELLRTSNRTAEDFEGCLSIGKGVRRSRIARPVKCDVTWRDLDGALNASTLSGRTARIFLHEFDHLNGVLMTDHLLPVPPRPVLRIDP